MANSQHPQPSLNQCRARIDRAREHIKNLEDKLSVLTNRSAISWTKNDSAGRLVIPTENLPPITPILIGETLYNLRGALDYLVGQLFYLATGNFDSRTKFLVEDSAAAWNRHLTHKAGGKRPWLPMLRVKHQDALKGFQPFNGCKWTKALQIHSNIDKHRHFLIAKGARIVRATADWLPGSGRTVTSGITADRKTKNDFARSVLFDDGTAVIETLTEIEQGVSDVVQAFDADFK